MAEKGAADSPGDAVAPEAEGSLGDTSAQKLVRKYLHCYAPATVSGFADWLGCSSAQAQRIWQTASDEIEPVNLSGKECYALSSDKKLLLSPPDLKRSVHLLNAHDPYLDLRDRDLILNDKVKQKQIWQTVSNPGAVLFSGEIVGMWKAKRKKSLDIELTLWQPAKVSQAEIELLCSSYAHFFGLKLNKLTYG